MASKPGQIRNSGQTAGNEVAQSLGKEFDKPIAPTIDTERQRRWGDYGFHHFPLDWTGEQRHRLHQVKSKVNGMMQREFSEAYAIVNDVYDQVREPELDGDEIKVDVLGNPIWKRNPSGSYIEHWERLTIKQRESFLYQVTTAIFEWNQKSEDLRGEALFAKNIWQDEFSAGFDAPATGTVDDRTAAGNLASSNQRHFATMLGMAARKAEAIVKDMERISLRLAQGLTQ